MEGFPVARHWNGGVRAGGAVEGWRFWFLFRQERGIPTSPLRELLIGNDRMFSKEQVQGQQQLATGCA